MNEIVARQQQSLWFVLPLFVAFFTFLVSAFAETNRLPFDLPEAEAELIAGYHTEYSAMKFSMFYIAEYSNMVTASALMVTLFFGGWDIPFTAWDNTPPWTVLKFVVTFGAFWAKVLFFMFAYIWVRWTLPRFRFDQLMDLGWKVLLPIALGFVMVVAVSVWGARGGRRPVRDRLRPRADGGERGAGRADLQGAGRQPRDRRLGVASARPVARAGGPREGSRVTWR